MASWHEGQLLAEQCSSRAIEARLQLLGTIQANLLAPFVVRHCHWL